MMAPYLLRLLCLSLAAFFVVHSLTGLIVALVAPFAVRAAQSMNARRAAGFLLALRLLPAGLALLLVAGLCVPSYLLLEQEASVEEVGALCLVAAVLATCLWSASIGRSVRAMARSLRHGRDWERLGSRATLSGARRPVCMVDAPAPLLALSGVLRTRLVISRAVAGVLLPHELHAALRHEEAHRASHDNLKRLLLLLSPGLFPGCHGFHALERGWYRFSEWAADDEAVAGNPRLSISLAAALVRIARMGGTPATSPLAASFLADGRDLTARVDRLLRPAISLPAPRRTPLIGMAVMFVAGVVAVALNAPMLESAHSLLEHLIH